MEHLSIAKLGKPHGLKGQVKAFSLTDFPKLRFKKGYVYTLVTPTGEELSLTLSSCSIAGEKLILGFKEWTTPEDPVPYVGSFLDMDKADAPMPKGYIRYGEIVGFSGVDSDGNILGTLLDVVTYSPTPNLKFKKKDGTVFYVPFIDEFVGEISYEEKTILIHVVEGML